MDVDLIWKDLDGDATTLGWVTPAGAVAVAPPPRSLRGRTNAAGIVLQRCLLLERGVHRALVGERSLERWAPEFAVASLMQSNSNVRLFNRCLMILDEDMMKIFGINHSIIADESSNTVDVRC
jgi:hypothetical protein